MGSQFNQICLLAINQHLSKSTAQAKHSAYSQSLDWNNSENTIPQGHD